MKVFLDTSVLVAASRAADLRYQASQRLLAGCTPKDSFGSAHSLAEAYANFTGMPRPHRFSPVEASKVLQHIALKLTFISLSAEELLAVTLQMAESGLAGGIVYDALILDCARKVRAEQIYTWNVRDFQRVAPDLADKIATP